VSSVIVVKHGFRRAVIAAGLRGAPGTGGGGSAGVSSFNTRTGAVTLTGADVTGALAYIPANNASLAAVAFSGLYSSLSGKPVIPSVPSDIGAATAAQGAKADSAVQPGSLAGVATTGSYDDLIDKPFIPSSPGDINAATAVQGALADTAVQPGVLAGGLDAKVDKVTGLGLSQESFTTIEKAKLAGLDGPLWKGTFPSLAALQAAHPSAEPGASAHVDAGLGEAVQLYIWDDSDGEWIASGGEAAPITAAQVKTLYESNADTNAFTDGEKSKLGGVASGATANADTDSLVEGGSNKWFTTARVLATVLGGLNLAIGTAVVDSDSVLAAIGKLQRQLNDHFGAGGTAHAVVTTLVDGFMSAADKVKLNGVATGATANSSDATLLDRENHEGTQAQTTVVGLVDDLAGKQATLVSGTNIKSVNGSSLMGGGDLVVGLAPLVTESTTSRTLALTDVMAYIRHTNASASTVTVPPQSSVAWVADAEIHIRRAAASNLTLTPGSGVTLNAPSGGTLILTNAMSVTLKRVGPDEWDVIGQTVAA
jgi:hypothetical protein